MTKFHNQTMYFESGSRCYVYNKPFTARVFIECGSTDGFTLNEKSNACHYDFIYTTKIGCNSLKLDSIQNKIKDLILNVN